AADHRPGHHHPRRRQPGSCPGRCRRLRPGRAPDRSVAEGIMTQEPPTAPDCMPLDLAKLLELIEQYGYDRYDEGRGMNDSGASTATMAKIEEMLGVTR